jgi:predicted DNA-binding ribbon-helix-helix protein
MWETLADISEREGQSIHSIATEIDRQRGKTAMTAAVRVFVLGYYQ